MLSKIYRSVIYVSLIAGLASYNPVLAIISKFIRLKPPTLSSSNTAAQENTQEQNTRNIDLSGEGTSSGNNQSTELYTMPEIECFGDFHLQGGIAYHQKEQLASSLTACKIIQKNRFVIVENHTEILSQFLFDLQLFLTDHGITAADAECRNEIGKTFDTIPCDHSIFLHACTTSEQLAHSIYNEATIALEQALMPPRFKPQVKNYLNNMLKIIQNNSSFIKTFIHQNQTYKGKKIEDLGTNVDLNKRMITYLQQQQCSPLLIEQLSTRPLEHASSFGHLLDLSVLNLILQNWNRRHLVICAGNGHIHNLGTFFKTIFNYTESDRQGYTSCTYPYGSAPDGTIYYCKETMFDSHADYNEKPKQLYLTKEAFDDDEKFYKDHPDFQIQSYSPNKKATFHLRPINITKALLKPRWTKRSERPCIQACQTFSRNQPETPNTLIGQAMALSKTPAPEKILSADNVRMIHRGLRSYFTKS